jgi:hypothetical protein
MWEFEENPIMIEKVGVKITNFSKVQKGHNSGNSLARINKNFQHMKKRKKRA